MMGGLRHTHILVCSLSDNLPDIVKCFSLSLSNPEISTLLEVLSGEGFVVTTICSSAACFVSAAM